MVPIRRHSSVRSLLFRACLDGFPIQDPTTILLQPLLTAGADSLPVWIWTLDRKPGANQVAFILLQISFGWAGIHRDAFRFGSTSRREAMTIGDRGYFQRPLEIRHDRLIQFLEKRQNFLSWQFGR